jgi:hypothetical protein
LPLIYAVSAGNITNATVSRIGLRKLNDIFDDFELNIYLGPGGKNLNLVFKETGTPVSFLIDSEAAIWEYDYESSFAAACLVNRSALM